MRTSYLDHDGPIAMAHRGFSREGLENSMPAFAAAVDLGYRYVETDVHATRDGVCVALHDATLDRVTDRAGAVHELPWAEVARARIGGHPEAGVPRLDELLHTWPYLRVNIDVKSPGAIGPLVQVIERARAHERVCLASFSDARRRNVERRLSRPVVTSGGRGAGAAFVAGAALGRRLSGAAVARALRDVDGLQVPVRQGRIPVVTARTVAAAHAAGAFVHVWTINDSAEMHRLLDLGADGLVTDRADLLLEVLAQR